MAAVIGTADGAKSLIRADYVCADAIHLTKTSWFVRTPFLTGTRWQRLTVQCTTCRQYGRVDVKNRGLVFLSRRSTASYSCETEAGQEQNQGAAFHCGDGGSLGRGR